MLKVMVKDASVEDKSGKAKGTGRPYSMRVQRAWVMLPKKAFPVEVQVILQDDKPPFAVGDYQINAECFYVGQFGKIEVDLAHMVSVASAAAGTRLAG